MEEALGTQLGEVWDGMKISDKTNVVKGIVEIEKKLLSVSFTRFVFCRMKWRQRIVLTSHQVRQYLLRKRCISRL